MSPDQYQTIVQEAPHKLRENLGELEDKVLEAAREALTASQDSDDGGNPKARISLKVVIDLSQSPPVWHTEASVGITYKVKSDAEQCDETPELLPGIGKGRKATNKEKDAAVQRFSDVVDKLKEEGIDMTISTPAADAFKKFSDGLEDIKIKGKKK